MSRYPDDTDLVYVIDDDPSVRTALARLLTADGHTVQTFSSAQQFLDYQYPDATSCLVLDVRMPVMSGLDLQACLADRGNPLPIIFITAHGTVSESVRAMKAGACEFLEKPFEDQDLLDAVTKALARERVARKQRTDHQSVMRCFATLSTREKEVYELVVQGLINRDIANLLGTVEKTIKVHRGRVMEKMEAASLADLVRMAENHSLFSPRH